MATYANAAQANELIRNVAAYNNAILTQVAALMDIRTRYLALSPTGQQTIDQAISDAGYDPTEIKTIVNKWAQIDSAITTQGLAVVSQP